jgi:FSR family fosmidomycin resistance protein-like MFS transporter
MDGRSNAVLTLDIVSGLFGKLIPFGIGLVAYKFGVGISMWILLAGPIALLLGLPKNRLTLPHES